MNIEEGLKTAILLIKNRKALIKKDLDTLTKAKKLLGDDAITAKYITLVDITCELTLLIGEIDELMDGKHE